MWIRVMAGLTAYCAAWAAAGAGTSENELRIIAGPYLQYPTVTSIIVRWETNAPATSEAAWGAKSKELHWVRGNDGSLYHEVTLDNLEPSAHFLYCVRSTNATEETVESELYSFQTAVSGDAPFAFAVLCDMHSKGEVVPKLVEMAWAQRPNFALLVGDLVENGTKKEDWIEHFFPYMHPLSSRVALIPALGNHERDADLYYDYFSLPAPEYDYRFPYGNAEFFMVDSERPLGPGSEQYTWLDTALGSSRATWKIVCLHCPTYSSDRNDYGDTTDRRSYYGDKRVRPAAVLYDKHNVDLVWSGHIHSYERTLPIRNGAPVLKHGTVYMVTGGGGGSLEEAAAWRSPFMAKVFSGHHYCFVSVHGPTLRIESYDLDGRMFDWAELRK
ncbi:MAG TPA: metallophosphoesterase family protein [Candidatus Hydrogenedentes bacterium]|nr:metallophosphoesterase family protein [Candidatus Hydrogenedentota bacterium]HPG70162.1 metallophosphoesterase family protein [Candidatus Hydrogenedentota bacterium]